MIMIEWLFYFKFSRRFHQTLLNLGLILDFGRVKYVSQGVGRIEPILS